MSLSRRMVVAAGAALALAGPALADERLVPARKVFPYLDAYWRLPAARRNRFAIAYVLTKSRPTGAWLVDGAQRTPIPIHADGHFTRLPSAEQWDRAQVAIAGPPGAKYGVTVRLDAVIPLGNEIDAGTLAAAIAQANDGIKAAMGVAGLLAPKTDKVSFQDVAAGEVVYADGRRAALPLVKGAPCFEPAKYPGARAVRFAKAPSGAVLD